VESVLWHEPIIARARFRDKWGSVRPQEPRERDC
jgi:hypothetical protein